MTQDQWDIYKLDPEYDCVVRAPPIFTTITRRMHNMNGLDMDSTSVSNLPNAPKGPPSVDSHSSTSKVRPVYSPSLDSESPPKRRKYQSAFPSETGMVVDEDASHVPSPPTHQSNDDVVNRMKRRWVPDPVDEGATQAEALKGEVPRGRGMGLSHPITTILRLITTFDIESPVFANLSSNRHSADGVNVSSNESPAKKLRTRSPSAIKQELGGKRMIRLKSRKTRREAQLKLRKDNLHRAFWDGLGVPPTLHDPGLYEGTHQSDNYGDSEGESDDAFEAPGDSTMDDEDEAKRLKQIEESRRKLAELEKDRPLWEESARKRQAREREEEQMRQRAKRMEEMEERQRQQAQAARQQREAKQEQEHREREREARMKEQSRRMFVVAPRGLQWNLRYALRRYLAISASFDATNFSVGDKQATFATIPWPVLHPSFSIREIQWDAVEMFFSNVRGLLTAAEFRDLVEKSQRRFHPDRWRSRGVLVSNKDDLERDLLEVAGSTVAQAITPLWKQVTGR